MQKEKLKKNSTTGLKGYSYEDIKLHRKKKP